MKLLMDVKVLLAPIWTNHSRHAECFKWLAGKELVVCPLTELGYLRISTNKKTINAPMEKARELLHRFLAERNVGRIPDDLPALQSAAKSSEEVTDHYLANLAAQHGLKLATLDRNLTHPNAELIA